MAATSRDTFLKHPGIIYCCDTAQPRSIRTRTFGSISADAAAHWVAREAAQASDGPMPPLALTVSISSNCGRASWRDAHAGADRAAPPPRRTPRRPYDRADRVAVRRRRRTTTRQARPRHQRREAFARHPLRRPLPQSALAQASTVLAIGPIESSVWLKGKGAGGRDALPARLEADEAAQRRRNPHRAAGIGADGDLAHAVGGGDPGAGGGPAGDSGTVGRIAGRAEMRIGADGGKGKLGHVGLGDDDRAAVRSRCTTGASAVAGAAPRREFSSRRGWLAGDIEQVLDADDLAVERAERGAARRPGIGGVGGGAGRLRIDREAGPHPLTVRIGNAGERLFEAVATRTDHVMARLGAAADHIGRTKLFGVHRCDITAAKPPYWQKLKDATRGNYHGKCKAEHCLHRLRRSGPGDRRRVARRGRRTDGGLGHPVPEKPGRRVRQAAAASERASRDSAAEAVRGADIVISAVTAASSLEAMQPIKAHLFGKPLLDINSVSPGRKQETAKLLGDAARYVDVAVLAPIYPARHKTPMLIAGADAEAVAPMLAALGMRASIAGAEIGAAAAIKMVRSVMIKGIEALTLDASSPPRAPASSTRSPAR